MSERRGEEEEVSMRMQQSGAKSFQWQQQRQNQQLQHIKMKSKISRPSGLTAAALPNIPSLKPQFLLVLLSLISSSRLLAQIESLEQPAKDIELSRLQPAVASSSSQTSFYSTLTSSSLETDENAPKPDFLTPPEADPEELEANSKTPFDYHANMPVITKRELGNAIKQAQGNVRKLRESAESPSGMGELEVGSPGWLASSMFHKITLDAQVANQTSQALVSEEATRLLAKQYKLNQAQTTRGLPLISVDQTSLGKLCPRQAKSFNCLPGRYRSLSGHCNNVQNPDWGAAQSALVRYAPARYVDNIARPFKVPLPSARAVSRALYQANSEQSQQQPHSHMTTMMSFFAQFIFHDLAHISRYTPQSQSTIKCCAANSAHPECMPIKLDNYCLDYVRSTPAVRPGCNLGPRDQLNLVSSFLDGSAVYGSSEEQMRRLRTFTGGRMRSQRAPMQGLPVGGEKQQLELLPQIGANLPAAKPGQSQPAAGASHVDQIWAAAADECRQMARLRRKSATGDGGASRCFLAGDNRANEHIGLTLMHTIWLREHNYIADKLSQLNKHWRDERIFEEARRILIAELQHITFSELLPNVLGEEVMQRLNLSLLNQGYSQDYDPQLNAGISNELAVAVFPFILSTIPSSLERYSDRLEILGSTQLADTFMDGSELFKRNMFAQLLMGTISQNALEPVSGVTQMMSDETTLGLDRNRTRRAPSGGSSSPVSALPPQVDVVALTIQQGRDHGLRSYLHWRQTCKLAPVVRSWQDLGQIMAPSVVERLQQVYSSPQQLDLYLAVLETPLPGSLLGPTLVCLLARQFFHIKHGDRYWFENDLPQSAFSPKQLEQIRQTSLAKVLCRNSQTTVNFVQPSPLIQSDPYLNAYQYCTNKAMINLDLSKWRETVQSAQQITDELLMNELDENEKQEALIRGRRFAQDNQQVILDSFERAKRQLDSLGYEETVKLRRLRRAAAEKSGSGSQHAHQGYRYLPRLKRQTLKLNNQSLIFELATNEVIRALVHQGKDREQAQSIQNDIGNLLRSLESVQLNQLLDNSDGSARLRNLIESAGGNFLTAEQRQRLAQANDPTLSTDPLIDFGGFAATASLDTQSTRSSSVSMNCQDDDRVFPCDHTSAYRTITGWCNNLQNPKFGQSFTPLDRILPNAYEDGLSKPRQFSLAIANPETGERLALPSARLISTTIHEDKSHLHVRYSLALMQFGQFGVDHDLTRTPFSVAIDGSLLDCSPCDSRETVHRDCLPIEIPDNDAHFNSDRAKELTGSGRKCLHFVRSLNGQTGLGPRQQINALTAYLDGSEIYGSDNCEAKSLRSFVGGRLNSSAYPVAGAKEILPITLANPECATPNKFCFHAGDQRASEQPGLTAIHTIFLRLHNSLVGQLAQVNRHWQDERLYQEGRRIVSAIMQRITYNEFAPRLLGLDYMSRFDLLLKNVGYSDNYDETCSASILTEFAAAAFRMGHSLIRNAFPLLNKQYKPIGKAFQLRKAFFNSQRILTEPNLIDSILRGIVTTPIESLDNAITEELTNHLFEKPKEPFSGMDLISLNIQRARDHGINPYNKYRVKCNLTRAKTFDDLSGEIPAKLIKRLSKLYASVDDIDLFTGGMSELPVHGGIIGPTFGCIIGMQLSRLKRCDRFWHETSDPFVRFSSAQLAEVRKMTLAKVICQESDNIDTIQRQAMDISDSHLNPRVACSSLPSMDLSVWRENQKSCLIQKVKIDLGQSKRISACKSCTCTLEGPVCRTAKINCLQAMKQASTTKLSTIMADKSCLVQCAWALDMQALAA